MAISPKAPLEKSRVRPLADGDRPFTPWLIPLFFILSVATHTITGQKVAMKYISKAVIHMTKTKTRVQREVEYMRTLRHPHIIKLYVYIRIPYTSPTFCDTCRHVDMRLYPPRQIS